MEATPRNPDDPPKLPLPPPRDRPPLDLEPRLVTRRGGRGWSMPRGGGKGGTPSPPSCCFRRRDLPRGRSSSGVAPCSDPIPDPCCCMLLLIQSMQHAAASSIKARPGSAAAGDRSSRQAAQQQQQPASSRRQRQQQQQPAAHLANSQIWRDLDRRQNPKYANQPRNCQCQLNCRYATPLAKMRSCAVTATAPTVLHTHSKRT
jgi:hypothetical protein